ncbi:MAG: 4-hydroxyphenylacetate 3-monooxygenase [Acetobacteraceae bacterium]|nr:4-hydroxyphenylacetate 3-monooxygenase [Acetobacteraceae bacterium]
MIRTAEAYREGLRDGREVWIDNERVADVTKHPALKPIIDVKARMYEMALEPAYQPALTYIENGTRHSTFQRPHARPITGPTRPRRWISSSRTSAASSRASAMKQ